MMSNLNNTIDTLIGFYNSGRNPREIMNMLIQQNPQVKQMMVQVQNMAQGRSPQEFITQLAKQNGVEQNKIDQLMKMVGHK